MELLDARTTRASTRGAPLALCLLLSIILSGCFGPAPPRSTSGVPTEQLKLVLYGVHSEQDAELVVFLSFQEVSNTGGPSRPVELGAGDELAAGAIDGTGRTLPTTLTSNRDLFESIPALREDETYELRIEEGVPPVQITVSLDRARATNAPDTMVTIPALFRTLSPLPGTRFASTENVEFAWELSGPSGESGPAGYAAGVGVTRQCGNASEPGFAFVPFNVEIDSGSSPEVLSARDLIGETADANCLVEAYLASFLFGQGPPPMSIPVQVSPDPSFAPDAGEGLVADAFGVTPKRIALTID